MRITRRYDDQDYALWVNTPYGNTCFEIEFGLNGQRSWFDAPYDAGEVYIRYATHFPLRQL